MSIEQIGDEYEISGIWCQGVYDDVNQSTPSYYLENATWYKMRVKVNPDSPFGFSICSFAFNSSEAVTEEDLWGEGGLTDFGPHAALPDGQ